MPPPPKPAATSSRVSQESVLKYKESIFRLIKFLPLGGAFDKAGLENALRECQEYGANCAAITGGIADVTSGAKKSITCFVGVFYKHKCAELNITPDSLLYQHMKNNRDLVFKSLLTNAETIDTPLNLAVSPTIERWALRVIRDYANVVTGNKIADISSSIRTSARSLEEEGIATARIMATLSSNKRPRSSSLLQPEPPAPQAWPSGANTRLRLSVDGYAAQPPITPERWAELDRRQRSASQGSPPGASSPFGR